MWFRNSFVSLILSLAGSNAWAAADSYRFLHVTIDTPWIIFVFLLFIVMLPFVLSAVLYWYFAMKKDTKGTQNQSSVEDSSSE